MQTVIRIENSEEEITTVMSKYKLPYAIRIGELLELSQFPVSRFMGIDESQENTTLSLHGHTFKYKFYEVVKIINSFTGDTPVKAITAVPIIPQEVKSE